MASAFETYFSGNNANISRRDTIVVVNCVLNAPLMLISIIGNSLVLAAILTTPSLRSPSIILLGSLAVSDVLVGLVVQPHHIAAYLLKNISLHKAMAIMAYVACGVSLLTMTAIAVDRFLALHYHMRYPNLITTSRATYISATIWIIALLLPFSFFWNSRVYLVVAVVPIVSCLITCTVCYIKIYRIVRQHQIHIRVQQQAVATLNDKNNRDFKQSKKIAINTFMYYIAMILCYMPLFITKIVLVISPNVWTVQYILADTLVFMNSSINPFLYCWRLRELRAVVIKTAKQMLCKQTEDN